LDYFTLEYMTERLCRNVGKGLPLHLLGGPEKSNSLLLRELKSRWIVKGPVEADFKMAEFYCKKRTNTNSSAQNGEQQFESLRYEVNLSSYRTAV
jgi:hypothetical protein